MSELLLLARIAARNLFGSFLNIIIGGIILVGTLLFVVGGSLLSSIDAAMSKSITGSIAGHAQVYSDRSKDELSLFGDWVIPDIAAIPDFSAIKPVILSVDNVKAVVPMGINGANVIYGNTVDLILGKLRKAENARLAGDASAETRARIESLKSHVREMAGVIQTDYQKLASLASKDAIDPEAVKALEKANAPAFWDGFDRDPLAHLEFMENKIASLIPDADLIFFSFMGTDLDAFRRSFDRMEIVDGQAVPSGQRGLLLSKYVYENQFKLRTAHRLDKINEALRDEGKKIATDPDLRLMIKQNRTQIRELLLQLDPLSLQQAVASLQGFLKTQEKDPATLLSSFFDTNDANFVERYHFFYDKIAPLIELYRLRPGDFLPIKAFTKNGFVQSANVKVYGTFQFKGLEKSGLAGAISLMDLMTFRDLYGYFTPEKLAESKRLQESAGAQFVDRDKAESALFGGDSVVVSRGEQKSVDEKTQLGGVHYGNVSAAELEHVSSQADIEKGLVLNAALILKDPSKLKQTIKDVNAAAKKANLNLRVVSWQKASGSVGQFVLVTKVALYFAVFIIFVVALVIINNAVMMATLQRVREIGTMRAIGAQRRFVLSLILIETLFLGLVFGLTGTLLGSLLVKWLGHRGIPSTNEFLYFFFSGPRLHMTLSMGSVIGAFLVICVTASISALYPAMVATRVSPVEAMQSEE
jgi:ABC-type lipoprotein release transport system permease subunit